MVAGKPTITCFFYAISNRITGGTICAGSNAELVISLTGSPPWTVSYRMDNDPHVYKGINNIYLQYLSSIERLFVCSFVDWVVFFFLFLFAFL